MRKFIALAMFALFASVACAQTVTVTKKTERIKGESADGFSSDLDGKSEDVRSALSKFLKDAGKARNNGEMIAITEPVLNGTIYSKGILYATVAGSDVKTRVWIGILASEWNESDRESALKEIEQMVYRFGVKFYRDKIQLQIDEAQQATDAVMKQAQRAQTEGKNLNSKLQNNDQERVRLEKALEANKLEDLVLKQKIINNKNSQDSLASAAEKIQKVLEMHKERQKKVN